MTRILVVDDDTAYCALVREVLSDDPRSVVVAEVYDAFSALDIIPEFLPDLVLMDVELPGMDGLEATAKIHLQFSSIRVIVMSGQEERAYHQLALEAGAENFIPKRQLSARKVLQGVNN